MPEPAEAMVSAVASAHFSREIEAPSSARDRAQRAFTITGAVATTLVAAGVFTDVASASVLARALGISAVVAWAIATALYTRAVASPVERVAEDKLSGAGEFVTAALAAARSEREEIDRRSVCAQRAVLVAIVVTLLALLSVLFAPTPTTQAELTLTSAGITVVQSACPDALRGNHLRGRVQIASLEDDFVLIEPAGRCAKSGVSLRVPKDDVSAESG